VTASAGNWLVDRLDGSGCYAVGYLSGRWATALTRIFWWWESSRLAGKARLSAGIWARSLWISIRRISRSIVDNTHSVKKNEALSISLIVRDLYKKVLQAPGLRYILVVVCWWISSVGDHSSSTRRRWSFSGFFAWIHVTVPSRSRQPHAVEQS